MAVLPTGIGPVTGYNIERSLRFNSADSAYLNRTCGTPTDNAKFTWSCWVKRTTLGTDQIVIGGYENSTNRGAVIFTSSDNLLVYRMVSSSGVNLRVTNAVFRDVGAWYHVVIVFDSNNATVANRVRVYVNGIEQTYSTSNDPGSGSGMYINRSATLNTIGQNGGSAGYLNGYMTEINFIDGQALTPSSFGETDSATGVWKPKAYSGTYGTNGFYLKFADNSGTTSTTLGKDSSGNGNNWTPNNFSVTAGAGNDSMVDSPTSYGTDTGVGGTVRGNYATFNPLQGTSTLSNGNLQIVGPVGDALRASTLGMTSGKWYAEITVASALSASASMGIAIYNQAALPTVNGTASRGYFYTGQKYSNGTLANYGTSFTNGDVIGIAIDLDNAKLWFSKNGTWQASGDPVAGTNAAYTDLGTTSTWFITVQTGGATGGATCHANFGQRAFAYTAPSGFKALCTQNLPTPTIGATSTTQANDYFNPVLYTGTGSSQSITGVGFQPGFVWIKGRSTSSSHHLFDAVRGVPKVLFTDGTYAEETRTNSFTSFDSDGFTVGSSSDGNTNVNTTTYVAWNWKANGAGSSNTAGTITSTVSANTTSGFSVVTYTGNGTTGATFGHGLGVTPDMIIIKKRSTGTAGNWIVYHTSTGINQYLYLNSTAGAATTSPTWGVSSTLVTLQQSFNDYNTSTAPYVAYCFDAVAGYSAFGSYTGNGSTDGPFVYTGFRPRYVMVKRFTGAGGVWEILDSSRDPYNAADKSLRANASDAEATGVGPIDFLSNGFKLRGIGGQTNDSGTYLYAAFAESPFKYALAR